MDKPSGLYNEWLACNDLGREFQQRIRAAFMPIIRDAFEGNVNLRDLEGLALGVIGTEVSTHVLMRTLRLREEEKRGR